MEAKFYKKNVAGSYSSMKVKYSRKSGFINNVNYFVQQKTNQNEYKSKGKNTHPTYSEGEQKAVVSCPTLLEVYVISPHLPV